MASILQSLQKTIIAGIVLLVVIVLAVGGGVEMDHAWGALDRKSTRLNSSH